MFDDPIVTEVRAVRDQLAARFNYDVLAIGAHYQQLEQQTALPTVTRPPKPARIRPRTMEQREETPAYEHEAAPAVL